MRKLHGLHPTRTPGFRAVRARLRRVRPRRSSSTRRAWSRASILYDEKRYLEAIDQFRIAAFGFLNRPDRLSASSRSPGPRPDGGEPPGRRGRHAQAASSNCSAGFPRIRRRTSSPSGRRSSGAFSCKRVQESTLLGIPSLAGLVETEEQKIARLPPAERRKALEAGRPPRSLLGRLAGRPRPGSRAARRLEGSGAMGGNGHHVQPSNAGRDRPSRQSSSHARRASRRRAPTSASFRRRSSRSVPSSTPTCSSPASTPATGRSPPKPCRRFPANLTTRPDVVKAQQKFAAERQRRAAQALLRGPRPGRSSGNAPPPRPRCAANPAARSQAVLAQSRQLVLAGRASRSAGGPGRGAEGRPGEPGASAGASRGRLPVALLP